MILVKVLKQAGETGLRLPGTSYLEFEQTAIKLQQRGLVEIIEPLKKELKTKIETKELKLKKETKKRGPKKRK